MLSSRSGEIDAAPSLRGETTTGVAASSSLTFDNSSAEEMDAKRKEELEQQKVNKWMMEKKLAAMKLESGNS